MGADLYISALYDPVQEQWEPEFERAARERDSAQDETSRLASQLRVEHAYEQMYSRGYFRDSYNDWNLLWKFGLSWWTDIIPMLDSEAHLSPEKATRFLGMLKECESNFEAALGQLKADHQASFRKRYAALQKFLNEAIDLNQPIVCSL